MILSNGLVFIYFSLRSPDPLFRGNATKQHKEETFLRGRECPAPPSVDQVELHPLLPQTHLREYCRAHGIVLQAYASLATGHPSLLAHPEVLFWRQGIGSFQMRTRGATALVADIAAGGGHRRRALKKCGPSAAAMGASARFGFLGQPERIWACQMSLSEQCTSHTSPRFSAWILTPPSCQCKTWAPG